MTNNRIEIFKDFLNHQSNFIRGYHEKSPKKNNKTENYAVIVEPRSDHYLLETVCRNIMYYLPDDWNLIVYSYDINIVREKLKNIDFYFLRHQKHRSPQKNILNYLCQSNFGKIFQETMYLYFKLIVT
jgi:hypothetical protein